MVFILSVIGVVLIIEGLPYFASPGKAREWAMTIFELENGTLRKFGLLAMATGLLLIFFAKHFL